MVGLRALSVGNRIPSDYDVKLATNVVYSFTPNLTTAPEPVDLKAEIGFGELGFPTTR